MSEEVCNHLSCGMLVKDLKGRYLLIERMKYPIGFACPAGHLEEGESFEQAAKRELKEEVGLEAVSLKEILHEKSQNPCRRKGGDRDFVTGILCDRDFVTFHATGIL